MRGVADTGQGQRWLGGTTCGIARRCEAAPSRRRGGV